MPIPSDQARRTADALVQRSEKKFSGMSLIANKQVALWKAGLIALFAAGVFSALAFIGGTNYGSSTQAAGLEMPAPDARRAKVIIEHMDPSEGMMGAKVMLFGRNFSREDNIVHFSAGVVMGLPSSPDPNDKKMSIISFIVPEYLMPRCVYQRRPCRVPLNPVTPGKYQVWVQNERDQKSQAVMFTVVEARKKPVAETISPSSGPIGAKVEITGSGFSFPPPQREPQIAPGVGYENYVKFTPANGGASGYVQAFSPQGTALTFAIPGFLNPIVCIVAPCPLAGTAEAAPAVLPVTPGHYLFTVVNYNGESNPVKFEVTPPVGSVRIDSITPEKGPVGTKVGIVGSGFAALKPDGLPAKNYIKFTRPDGSLLGYAGGLAEGDTRITFTLPSEVDRSICITDPCPIPPPVYLAPVTPGVYLLSVVNQNGESNPVKFEVTGGQTVAVKLERIEPATGPVGTKVVLAGQGFTKTGNMVHFGGGSIGYVDSADGKTITFNIPWGIGSACDFFTPPCPGPAPRQVMPGEYRIMVSNQNGVSNELTFTVTTVDNKAPVLQGVNPTSGKVGDKIVLTGSGFARRLPDGPASVNYIKFILSDSKIAGYMPAYSYDGMTMVFSIPEYINPCPPFLYDGGCGAIVHPVNPGSYALTVVNQNGESNAVKFEVTGGQTVAVKLERMSPVMGPIGTQVGVGGAGFTPTGNTVHFGLGEITGLKAEIGSSGGMLYFTIPTHIFLPPPECDQYASPLPCPLKPVPVPVQPGEYPISVSNANGMSNEMTFTVIVY